MKMHLTLATTLTVAFSACVADSPSNPVGSESTAATPVAAESPGQGLVRKAVPGDDPGPPFYSRVTPILDQFFHTDGWLAIPFYRDPVCVPPDFNLLDLYDPPTGPTDPGAFGCPLQVEGSLLIERDAPLGTFPRQVVLKGDAVPFLFVDWDGFQQQAADGVVTLAELEEMGGGWATATRFHETLKPRIGEHLVVIQASGTTDDGRHFRFGVTHEEDRTVSIRLRFR